MADGKFQVNIRIECDDNPKFEKSITIFCDVDDQGKVEVKCPNCPQLFGIDTEVLVKNKRIRCIECNYEGPSQEFLLELHPEVMKQYSKHATEVMTDEIGKMLEDAFKGKKSIKFKRK